MKIGSPNRKCRRAEAKCLMCHEMFLADVTEIRRGKGQYCSVNCKSAAGGRALAKTYPSMKREPGEGVRANGLINMRIRRGRLIRPDRCEQCGRLGKVDAHHADYAKPAEVQWLCRPCHCALRFQ